MGKKKILMIDDEPELVDMVKKRLEASGYDFIGSYDGASGMEAAVRDKPDLILLDVRMPRMDGYTFIKEIRVNNDLKKIPIIVLSIVDQLSEVFKLEGVIDYIEKPFDTEELLEKIRVCIEKE